MPLQVIEHNINGDVQISLESKSGTQGPVGIHISSSNSETPVVVEGEVHAALSMRTTLN